jgi:hypothetical protein
VTVPGCADADTNVFFPIQGRHSWDAIRICLQNCLETNGPDYVTACHDATIAADLDEVDEMSYAPGVWGATTELQRKEIRMGRSTLEFAWAHNAAHFGTTTTGDTP